jgi:hypothetical protein
MRIGVHQPNFAPWCGYFAKMFACDAFVFFDDVQLPQGRSYVTRVKIAAGDSSDQWLTVPVQRSGLQRICDTRCAGDDWARRHIKTLQHVYAKAAHAGEIMNLIRPVFEDNHSMIAEFNMRLIERIARYLGWSGSLHRASDHPAGLQADRRIAQLVGDLGGDTYVSGAGGQKYQHESVYSANGITLEVLEYVPVSYERSGWPFVPGLSVLDALFHLGHSARDVLTYSS